jgi:mono/diheme cytochrome c family protein
MLIVSLGASAYLAGTALADDAAVERGKYLVTLGGCNDCHTPGALLGNPDMTRLLGGPLAADQGGRRCDRRVFTRFAAS